MNGPGRATNHHQKPRGLGFHTGESDSVLCGLSWQCDPQKGDSGVSIYLLVGPQHSTPTFRAGRGRITLALCFATLAVLSRVHVAAHVG